MGIDCKNNGIIKSSSGDQLPASAIAPLIDALTTCINSIHYAFDIILSVDSDRLTCLPTVALARTSYPLVSLIKIHCLLTAPDSRIGQVIDIESLKLEYYLDHITNHYRKAASLGGGRAVAKFGNIITMLRNWFVKQKDNGPALREIFATETNSEPEVKQPVRVLGFPKTRSQQASTNNYLDARKHHPPRTSQHSSILRPNKTRHRRPLLGTPKSNSLHPLNPNTRSPTNPITQPNKPTGPTKPPTKARTTLDHTNLLLTIHPQPKSIYIIHDTSLNHRVRSNKALLLTIPATIHNTKPQPTNPNIRRNSNGR